MSNSSGDNQGLPSPLASVSHSARTSLPSRISICPTGFDDLDFERTILEEILERTFLAVERNETPCQEPMGTTISKTLLEGKKSERASKSRHLVVAKAGSTVHSLGGSAGGVSVSCPENLVAAVGIQDLPDQLLELLLQKLPFEAVCQVGATNRRLRRVAASVLRRELRSLVPRMEGMMGTLEALVRQQLTAGTCLVPIMMRLMLHTLMRLLLGEARVLRAIFWRYVREDDANSPLDFASRVSADGSAVSGGSEMSRGRGGSGGSGGSRSSGADAGAAPHLCFSAGVLLDELESLLAEVSANNFSSDMEPEVASSLFMHTENFLDYFETMLEPGLPCGETPFGVKVMDLLGACDSSDCVLSVTHGAREQPFAATMHFELRDVSAVESPPPFDRQLPARVHLRMFFRYLRNNVRWSNFFRPMRELWDLQDELENRWQVRPGTGERRNISRHHALHQEVMQAVRDRVARGVLSTPPAAPQQFPPLPRSSSEYLPRPAYRHRQAYEQVVLQAEPPMWRETFTRCVNPLQRSLRLGLCCDLQLSGANKDLLPLDLEFLDERRVRSITHPYLSPQASLLASSKGPLQTPPTPLPATPLPCDLLPTSEPLTQPPTPPTPYLPQVGEAAIDWGPWFRIRIQNPPLESSHKLVQEGPWEDCGSDLRDGGDYGFRGEVRVTFPPRALSSIVTETVILVRDSDTESSLSSDRRFV